MHFYQGMWYLVESYENIVKSVIFQLKVQNVEYKL